MADAAFTHIHSSSLFMNTASSLEADLDVWMTKASLITLTEIQNNRRAATMRERGWRYFNAKRDQGYDQCGVCWAIEDWHLQRSWVRKLNDNAFTRGLTQRPSAPIVSCTVLLKSVQTGQTLLVSVVHMPAHVEGPGGWRTDLAKWQARKAAYLSSLKNWSIHIEDLERKKRPDGTLVVADWNLNLKQHWVRDLLHTRFDGHRQAWVQFPTEGGSMHGGPVAPLGPGKGSHAKIIDGTLYRGLKVTRHPNLMAAAESSDHRPYIEAFEFRKEVYAVAELESPSGDIVQGDAWWGFGDYMDDELYEFEFTKGAAGGEVLS